MNQTTTDADLEKQGDTLLWLAAALVAGIGLVWLLISQPWSSGASSPSAPIQTSAPVDSAPAVAPTPAERRPAEARGGDGSGSPFDDPLRMAELAYEAGMLTEPEDYSAWALYRRALDETPEKPAALAGLNKVAGDLLKRADAAIEQGRFDDARSTAKLITDALPNNAGAQALVAKIEKLSSRPAPTRRPVLTSAPRTNELEPARPSATAPVAPPPEAREPEPRADPIETMHAAFMRAMVENRLLTPAEDSARYHVQRMLETDPASELARQARELLVTEMLARSAQAVEALDMDAARTWIDEAERLAENAGPVAAARQRMNDALIAMESAKRLPASELTVLDYVPPEYPRNALQRGIEGWVDVEFTVAPDGTTRDIVVTDASNSTYFRDEAIAAVSQWRFEPRIFMNQPIAQQTYTRLRFVLDD
jgi:TonB family protein